MPNMSQYLKEDFPKNISINVGASYSFKNYKKIDEWCDAEIEFYKSIGENNTGSSFTQAIKNQLQIRFNQNRRTEISWDDFSQELKEFISSTYKSHGFIASRSKEGKFLARLHKANPKIVSGALQYFQQKTQPSSGVQLSQVHQRDGHFAAYLFDNDIEPDFEEEKSKYEDFYSEIIAQKDELLEELKNAKDENNSINQELTDLKTAVAKKFDEEFDRHKTKMEESEKFYESELAVKKSVTYWTDKAKIHKRNSIGFGIASGIMLVATVISVIFFGKYIIGLNLDDENGVGNRILTQSGALQIWIYAVFIGALTLVVWIIRLLVKIFLSNLHMFSDAKERETMIMTYLAFEREEQVLNKEDKNLILPSIFRVSSNGIIKEDSSPSPIMNFFTKGSTD